MMNDDRDKTVVRSRRMPPTASRYQPEEHSVNVLPVGTRLGEFEILELIGEGGFGIVYLAYDHSLERHVALKEYMPSGLATRTTRMAVTVRSQHNADTFTAGLKSFVNEARMLAQFDSPALVKVYRFWEANGTAYMVMPFYEGVTLKKALKEHRITPSENWIRMLLADLFDAIDTIHRVQCFHRDIAPDNILLLKDGRPLLLDFGAARRVIGDLTQGPTVILKPGFAPIEQYADIAGLRQGAWTDIYALAAVVYYLMTGRAPPPAVARVVKDEMVPAREVGKGRYSKNFLAVIDKALSVKPEQRYQSIVELRRALDIMESVPRSLPRTSANWGNTDVPTVPIAPPGPERKPDKSAEPRPVAQPDRDWQRARGMNHSSLEGTPSRRTPAWAALGLLLLAGLAAGGYWGMQYWNTPHDIAAAGAGSAPVAQSSGSSGAPEEPAAAPESAATPPPSAAAPASDAAAPSSGAAAPSPGAGKPEAAATPPVASTGEPAPSVSAAPRDALNSGESGNSARPHEAAPAHDTPAPQRAARMQSEEDLWRVASASDRNDAYEFYLNRYPKGRYAAAARQKLKRKPPAPKVEENPSEVAMLPAPRESAAAKPAPDSSGSSSEDEGTPAQPAAPPALASAAPSSAAAAASSQPPAPSAAPAAESAAPAASAPPAAPSAAEADDSAWQAATAADKIADYQHYLEKYPNGRHAQAAGNKLASLKRQLEPATAPPAEQSKAAAEEGGPTDKPATGNTVLRMANQTMTGRFVADPRTGIVSGTGRIVWRNGDRFEGTLVNGVKQGKGEFTWSNGQRYKGDWANDMPNGRGTIYYANGNRYDGQVKDGRPHGQGVTRFKGGDVYAGSWVMGKSQGSGRYTWANGSYWEGEFRDDRRTDNGRMVFADAGPAPAAASGAGQASGSAAAGKD
ncbi:MAG TPA: protein kinase [Noviherbaspirillum sp.]|nr:protein kinase [Noviherbaspirillum sp.]